MSVFYHAKRSRDLYSSTLEQFLLSRTKIENFVNCPRCFYIDRKLGVAQPPGFPFSLNKAVDTLLKKEFDIHRVKKSKHPLMERYGINAVPFDHPKIEEWRDTRKGIACRVEGTNFLVYGGVDDVWVNPEGELLLVDYKATSKTSEVNIDADWQWGYKRQLEIYQWLFRQNGFSVNPTGYFVYANGDADKEAFDGKLEFSIKIIPYTPDRDDTWVKETVVDAYFCLNSKDLPQPGPDCDFCSYRKEVGEVIKGLDAAPYISPRSSRQPLAEV